MGDARDVETTASEVPKTLKQITALPEYARIPSLAILGLPLWTSRWGRGCEIWTGEPRL